MRLMRAGLGLLAGAVGHHASRWAVVGRWGALDGRCGLSMGEDRQAVEGRGACGCVGLLRRDPSLCSNSGGTGATDPERVLSRGAVVVVRLDFGPNRLEYGEDGRFPVPPGRGVTAGDAAQFVVLDRERGAIGGVEM